MYWKTNGKQDNTDDYALFELILQMQSGGIWKSKGTDSMTVYETYSETIDLFYFDFVRNIFNIYELCKSIFQISIIFTNESLFLI